MHPDSQRFPIDDPRLFPMYDAVQGKIPVLLHMGDRRYNYSHPIKLQKILKLFPRLQVIAAHFGGYSMQETACELLRDTNCIMDVSSSIMFMKEGEAERYIRIYGAEPRRSTRSASSSLDFSFRNATAFSSTKTSK